MGRDGFELRIWLSSLLGSLPLVMTLLVGGVICLTQSERRPRAARFLGAAIVIQLFWILGAWYIAWAATRPLIGAAARADDFYVRILTSAIQSFPSSSVNAIVWGLVLWGLLGGQQVRRDSKSLLAGRPLGRNQIGEFQEDD